MTLTAAELVTAALALTPAERVEVAEGIMATLSDPELSDEARVVALRAAVASAEESIAQGRVVRVPGASLSDYVHARGERAARIADAQIA